MAKKGKGGLSAITSLFWAPDEDYEEEIDGTEDESVATTEGVAPAATTPTPALTAVTPQPVAVQGAEDEAIKNSLSGALSKANKEGYDYFEFAQAVKAQTKFIPAEQVRYQSVFAMAASMGITTESLISDINYYVDVLKQEAEKFQDMVDGQTAANVTLKEQELSGIDSAIEEKAAQIQQLTEEINQLSASKTDLANAISDNKASIEKVQSNFGATLKVFIDRLIGDSEKIKRYLGGTTETIEPAKGGC